MLGIILQWVGNTGVLSSLWLVGEKKKVGFLIGALGNTSWGIYSLNIHLWSMAILSAVFIVLDIYYWFKWRRLYA